MDNITVYPTFYLTRTVWETQHTVLLPGIVTLVLSVVVLGLLVSLLSKEWGQAGLYLIASLTFGGLLYASFGTYETSKTETVGLVAVKDQIEVQGDLVIVNELPEDVHYSNTDSTAKKYLRFESKSGTRRLYDESGNYYPLSGDDVKILKEKGLIVKE